MCDKVQYARNCKERLGMNTNTQTVISAIFPTERYVTMLHVLPTACHRSPKVSPKNPRDFSSNDLKKYIMWHEKKRGDVIIHGHLGTSLMCSEKWRHDPGWRHQSELAINDWPILAGKGGHQMYDIPLSYQHVKGAGHYQVAVIPWNRIPDSDTAKSAT